ncbi:MAG: GNAT family N-acetyltransferase [Candidatus Bathyarchaeota archaeon]|nr:GNAT family N-acetyltransferase [Candidatus Bathyarchaeota archaeon]MDH5495799.1 GNAT family N-acetyltransferase [Candidatus Bathyarchaeota archaeon]
MIHELRKRDYQKVQPLFEELEWNLITSAVIEGTSPGRVYADRVEDPRTAFMCTVEGYYLAGYDNNDEFNTSLNKLIFARIFAGDTVRKDETDVAIGFHPDSWKEKMPIIFQGRTPLTTARRHYVCTELKVDHWMDHVPKGFQIQRIDEKLLRTPHLEIPEHVTGWMKTNWGSISDFMKKGFGFCTLLDKRIVSWSIADCVSGNACEIGIHTREDYRKQGLATLTAAAAVDHSLSSGFRQVGWHCDEYNLGSIGVAEKVGFKLERKYIQYYACANEAHHLEETAQAHFRAKRYKEAIESYEKFFATPPEELPKWLREILPQELGTHYFRVAYAKAAIGEDNGVLKYLEKAVDNGWLYIDFLMSCKEFESKHGTSAWNSILKKIRKKLNAH